MTTSCVSTPSECLKVARNLNNMGFSVWGKIHRMKIRCLHLRPVQGKWRKTKNNKTQKTPFNELRLSLQEKEIQQETFPFCFCQYAVRKSCVHKGVTTNEAMHLKGRPNDLNNGSADVFENMQMESEDMVVPFLSLGSWWGVRERVNSEASQVRVRDWIRFQGFSSLWGLWVQWEGSEFVLQFVFNC